MEHRPITVADIEQIARWNIELHQDEGSVPLSNTAAQNRLRKWLADKNLKGVIFVENNSQVGYAIFEHQSADPNLRASKQTIYIRQFFISREHRRSGIGSLAFQHFKNEVVSNTTRIALDVKATNPSGQKFWESLGCIPQHVRYHLE